MYESYYGFRDTPFRLSADEKFRYAHKNYLRASAYLAYALQQGEGFVMITGQPGSGKTTLVRDVISEIDADKFQALNLVTSQLHAEELLRKVALEYGLPAETYNKATLLTSIHKHLSSLHEQGKRSILFLDEAQNLSLNGLEELRLLSNLQQGRHSLLQIVLIGHDELRELLLGPGMEHIQQRLIAICQIQPMTEEQTREYVIHRLGVVGWRQNPRIQDEVYHLLHQASQGVPRNINHLMSRLLLFGSLEEKQELTDEDALTVIEELVDEQRITLAGQMTVEQFASRYRAAKQHQDMAQAVGDHPRNEAVRQTPHIVAPEPDPVLVERTQNITENFLSVIDEVPLESLEDWDSLDSDWLVWKDESQLHTERQSSLPQMNSESNVQSIPEPKPKQQQALAPVDKKTAAPLPSADDIWRGSLDSMDLGSVFSDARNEGRRSQSKPAKAQKRKPAKPSAAPKHAKDKQEPRLPASSDPEHRWGGVWFMSSENSSNPPHSSAGSVGNAQKSALPSVSLFSSSPSISVDENLSMPSLWVDGCPEINAHQETGHRGYPVKTGLRHKVKRSLLHIAAWVAVGGLLILMIRLFPDAFGRLWHEVEVKFLNERASIQTSPVPIGTDPVSASELTETSKSVEPVLLPPESGLPQRLEVSRPVLEVENNLGVGDPDVSSYENIELATRYFVYFDFNKFTIPTQYVPLLKSIQYKMLLDENSFLKITGYADPQGNKVYNDLLSLKRAEEVKQFFLQRGVDDVRLRVAAVGAISPESGRDTLDNRRDIRRVEVILFPN